MAPEKVGAKPFARRPAVYWFGVTCSPLRAGEPPFRGHSPFEVAVQHVQAEPVPLGQIRPDLPQELCALVHKMMAKRPEDRFQTGREIVREAGRLRDALVGLTARAHATPIAPRPTTPLPSDAAATPPIPVARPRPRLAGAGPPAAPP